MMSSFFQPYIKLVYQPTYSMDETVDVFEREVKNPKIYSAKIWSIKGCWVVSLNSYFANNPEMGKINLQY